MVIMVKFFFYQSELPYDVTESNFGTPGYTGYRVMSGVNTHTGHGIGVYSFFRDNSVTTASGITTNSTSTNVKFNNAVTWFITGNGQITHVINNKGNTVPPGKAYICTYP